MNLEQEGLYRRCLDLAWEHGSIPDDPKEIARLIQKDPREVKRAWTAVRACWQPNGEAGRLVNDREEKERKKAQERHSKASRAAAQKAAQHSAREPAQNGAQDTAPPPATRASGNLSSGFLCSSVVLKEKEDASIFSDERASEGFQAYFGIFIATGKLLNDNDMERCFKEWISRTPDYREKAYTHAESLCSGWSGDSYTPFPINHLTQHPWDRRSAGRSLPPVQPKTKTSAALDQATQMFMRGQK
jgi:uncharacterized protein YdaU (DUF1376 family)